MIWMPTIPFCPVTGNQPLTCTKKGFTESCRAFSGLFARKAVRRFEYCAICQGEVPTNVTFIEISTEEQEKIMAKAKPIVGVCASCGGDKNTTLHYGKMVCSVCMAMRGVAKNNPDVVIAALKEFGNMPSLEVEVIRSEGLSDEIKHLKKNLEETKQALSGLRQRNVDFFYRLAAAMHIAEEGMPDGIDDMVDAVATLDAENQRLREQIADATAELDAVTLVQQAEPPQPDAAHAAVLLYIVRDIMDGKITGLDVERLRRLM